ncbi:MAG TPA: diaminopimelate decarboxylase [Opitutaceae bacterium]|jgi:diaminopimelate decarboxylase|nr:diaminopimelate decarboxylase [Opitutaceae bacterium]
MPWWTRKGLGYRGRRLRLGSCDLQALAEKRGTPLYAYHGARIRANLGRLRGALAAEGLRARVFYAIKSNRFPPLLRLLRSAGAGADVCSPAELELARRCGFRPGAISYTGTAMSEEDARCLARHPQVRLNCDSLASLRRIARLSPGRRIGLRINPGVGLGYRANPRLRYAGERDTKFGIYAEQFEEALRLSARGGLAIAGLHFHAGCGFLTPQLPAVDRVFAAVRPFLERLPDLEYLNLGGGLGIPLVASDDPLDLAAWSRLVRRRFGRDKFEVWVEPGDYLVKDAGVLLLQVNMAERKRRTWFVGVNGGFNLHPEPAFYRLPLAPAPCELRTGPVRTFAIAGNINEALDLLAEKVRLPLPEEDDILAFLNAGGYGAAMSSNHCMRGSFQEVLLR